jgi:tetratricopeptide (TPR) repeat protein
MIEAFSSYALGQLADAIGGQRPVTIVDTRPLADAINQLQHTTAQLLDATSNPRRTAADELFRDGVMALEHGWLDDAIRDLGESVKARPYPPRPHLMLAIAHLRAGNAVVAVQELELTVKYAAADGPRDGVTAAILAANCYDGVGRGDLAHEILSSALRLGPSVSIAQAILLRGPDPEMHQLYLDWILGTRGEVPEFAGINADILARIRDQLTADLASLSRATEALSRSIREADRILDEPGLVPRFRSDADDQCIHDVLPGVLDDSLASLAATKSGLSAGALVPAATLADVIKKGEGKARALERDQRSLDTVATAVEDADLQLLHTMEKYSSLLGRGGWAERRLAKNVLAIASDIEPAWDQAADSLADLLETATKVVTEAVDTWNSRFPPRPAEFIEPLSPLPLILHGPEKAIPD